MRKRAIFLYSLFLVQYSLFSQNVGIGTTTPQGILHLKGTNWVKTIFENNTGEARGYIGADNNGTITLASNAYWDGSNWQYPNTGSSLYLLLHRLNNRYEFRVRPEGGNQAIAMTIDTGSNASIGGGLIIDQENGNSGILNSNSLRFGNLSGEGIGSKRNTGTGQYGLDFYTNGTNRMVIANNGNVGIGTTNPQAKLDVNGDVNIENRLLLNNTAGNSRQVLVSNGSSSAPTWQNVAYSNNDRFYFKTDTGLISALPNNYYTIPKFIQVYAYSTAITQSSPSAFLVNKSGLYSIMLDLTITANKSIASESGLLLMLFNISFPSAPAYSERFYSGSIPNYAGNFGGHIYTLSVKKEWKIYLPAGSSFSFYTTGVSSNVNTCLLEQDTGLSISLISE